MKTNWSITGAIAIVALMIGIGVGYFFTPQYQMRERTPMDLGQADRLVDLRYINAMAAHHRGAMLLAAQIKGKSDRPEIKNLVTAIETGEPKLIDELMTWKKEWYNDYRPVKDPTVVRIGPSDNTTDLRFLNALIAHHTAGIAMTNEIRLKSSRAEILNNADAVESFLTSSRAQLIKWRNTWYE